MESFGRFSLLLHLMHEVFSAIPERIRAGSHAVIFEARKVAQARPDISASAADILDEPVIVCRASGTCVTPKDCQRKK